jgi:hypothetical protein
VTDAIDTQFVVLDERFRACGGDRRIERLYTGCRFGGAQYPA